MTFLENRRPLNSLQIKGGGNRLNYKSLYRRKILSGKKFQKFENMVFKRKLKFPKIRF